ncbi:MAG TPA: DUF2461 domain-containing protein [Devosiaceae bacterium]|jgi:uncharacterized protein (TIGR02453 family)
MVAFSGVPDATFKFLSGIAAHNDKTWFEAHRDLYDTGYVAIGRALTAELGPRLRAISPQVQFEPKINGSIGRINRDIRFSKDKRPYKDHLSLWFWHGERRSLDCPGFWFQLTAGNVYVGGGMYHFDKQPLDNFRQSVINPQSGKALLAAVDKVRAAGDYEIGEKTRKRPPRGFETVPERAEYLLYEGLTTMTTLPAEVSRQADFIDICMTHFAATWPITKWLLDEVVD